VNTFQTDLASKLDVLSSTLNASIDQQNKHLKSVEHLCQSCVDSHDKVHIIGTLIGMPNSWPNYLNESILYINYVSLNI